MMRGLSDLADSVARRAGIRMGHGRLEALAAAVRRADPGMEGGRLMEALRGPRGDELLERIVDEVAVKETSFFREPGDLDALDWHSMLASAQRAGSPVVRVWSAACATGEEAYTLAILAIEAFGSTSPPVSILGTDISPTALERAQRGEYGARALRKADTALVSRHFERRGAGFGVAADVRALVEFRRHNLISDGPPEGWPCDLILCRNVLIYFDPATAAQVVDSLRGALRPGGMMLLGAADRLCVQPEPRQPIPERRRGARLATERAARRPRAAPAPRVAVPPPGAADPASLAEAIAAADSGRLSEALAATDALLVREPGSAPAHFVRGLALLAGSDPLAAAESFRAALYIEPSFAFAAFKLGRAFDGIGDERGARRAYEQALRSFDPDDVRYAELLDGIDVSDVAAACRARLAALAAAGG